MRVFVYFHRGKIMQVMTIKQDNGIFIQLPKHIIATMDTIISDFDDKTRQIQVSFFSKKEPYVSPEVKALSGSLKPYIGTDSDVLNDEQRAFLQEILDDDNRIKAEK